MRKEDKEDSWNQYVSFSITELLLDSTLCADAYNPNMFTILDVSNNGLQLSVIETLYITKHQPLLCKQK